MKTPITKPLLADEAEMDELVYPVIATPKYDGIRCLKIDGVAVSRNFKPIQNVFLRETLSKILPEGADGEIIVGQTFQECGAIMRFEGEPDFKYYMFDYVKNDLERPYVDRLKDMEKWFHKGQDPRIVLVQGILINNKKELKEYEKLCVDEGGYEGVMVRSVNGRYKCGRSHQSDGILLKIKRWKDSEMEITGFEEKMHNQNEAKKDAFGRTKRSTSKEGLVPAGTLGTLLGRDIHNKKWDDLRVGSGFDHALAKEIWDNRDKYLGKIVKYKYQPKGMKDKPRFPIFVGFRDPSDMS